MPQNRGQWGGNTGAQRRAQTRGPDGLGLELLCRATHAAQAPARAPAPQMYPSPPPATLSPSPHTPEGTLPNSPQDTRSHAVGPDRRRARQRGTSVHRRPSQGSAAAAGPVLSAEGTGGMLLGRGFRSLTRGTAQTVASASRQISKCPESFWPPSVPARAGAQPRGGGQALPPGILTPQ